MKGSQELKRYMAILRSLYGKKNGAVPRSCLDDLLLFKLEGDKKYRKRHRRPRDGRIH